MDSHTWRKRARFVAIFDYIFQSLLLAIGCALPVFALVGVYYGQFKDMNKLVGKCIIPILPEDIALYITSTQSSSRLWIVLGIGLLIVYIHIWVAAKLLEATEVGRELTQAHKFANYWRIANIVTLIVVILYIVQAKSPWLILMFMYLWRCCFLYIVNEFMGKLEKASLRNQIVLTLGADRPAPFNPQLYAVVAT